MQSECGHLTAECYSNILTQEYLLLFEELPGTFGPFVGVWHPWLILTAEG